MVEGVPESGEAVAHADEGLISQSACRLAAKQRPAFSHAEGPSSVMGIKANLLLILDIDSSSTQRKSGVGGLTFFSVYLNRDKVFFFFNSALLLHRTVTCFSKPWCGSTF